MKYLLVKSNVINYPLHALLEDSDAYENLQDSRADTTS